MGYHQVVTNHTSLCQQLVGEAGQLLSKILTGDEHARHVASRLLLLGVVVVSLVSSPFADKDGIPQIVHTSHCFITSKVNKEANTRFYHYCQTA